MLETGKEPDPMALRSFLAYYLEDNGDHAELPDISQMPRLPDEKAMIEFLDTADVKNEEKWYVLDILQVLKESSKYNLQLSESLGLSPSATSHYMSALLGCGFVTVEKKNGKVYYCLNRAVIEEFLATMGGILL